MYDAIIVGARCAGAPTAMLLARRGHRVLMVDKASFPSDMLSGHFIQPAGVARMHRWGVLDRVAQSGCPAIHETLLDFGTETIQGVPRPTVEGISAGYCPRRYVLDTILAEQAINDGVELWEGFTMERLIMEGDRVVGIRGTTPNGLEITERAGIVIGADGPNSRVARNVAAPVYDTAPSLTCAFYSYWSGVPCTKAEVYIRQGGRVIATPTHDGLTLVAVVWPEAIFAGIRPHIDRHYREALRDWAPDLAQRVENGVQADRYYGISRQENFFRKPYGDGWALAGDAGYHRDAITAQGISDAFRDADMLSEAVDAGLTGREPMIVALAGYEQSRNAAVRTMYGLTLQLADVHRPLTGDAQRLLAAIAERPEEIRRYLGVLAGTTPAEEYFAPHNIQQVLGETALPHTIPCGRRGTQMLSLLR